MTWSSSIKLFIIIVIVKILSIYQTIAGTATSSSFLSFLSWLIISLISQSDVWIGWCWVGTWSRSHWWIMTLAFNSIPVLILSLNLCWWSFLNWVILFYQSSSTLLRTKSVHIIIFSLFHSDLPFDVRFSFILQFFPFNFLSITRLDTSISSYTFASSEVSRFIYVRCLIRLLRDGFNTSIKSISISSSDLFMRTFKLTHLQSVLVQLITNNF